MKDKDALLVSEDTTLVISSNIITPLLEHINAYDKKSDRPDVLIEDVNALTVYIQDNNFSGFSLRVAHPTNPLMYSRFELTRGKLILSTLKEYISIIDNNVIKNSLGTIVSATNSNHIPLANQYAVSDIYDKTRDGNRAISKHDLFSILNTSPIFTVNDGLINPTYGKLYVYLRKYNMEVTSTDIKNIRHIDKNKEFKYGKILIVKDTVFKMLIEDSKEKTN